MELKDRIARSKICLPLDGLNTMDDIKKRVEELSCIAGVFKVGKESFTLFGPEVVKVVAGYGVDVFLDLKYHDIPNTVKGAAYAATKLGVYMFNVHAAGGSAMMKAAVEGVDKAVSEGFRRPFVIAVTVLTSIDREILNTELNVPGDVEDQVFSLAKLACDAGLDGIVCSAADLRFRDDLPNGFMYVTPGIKGVRTSAGSDQKRILTPSRAIESGATLIVVGRAITGHALQQERVAAGMEVLADVKAALHYSTD